MWDRDLVTVDLAGRVLSRCRWGEVCDQLMTKQVPVDPVIRLAALLEPEHTPVEVPGARQVVDGYGEVETADGWHLTNIPSQLLPGRPQRPSLSLNEYLWDCLRTASQLPAIDSGKLAVGLSPDRSGEVAGSAVAVVDICFVDEVPQEGCRYAEEVPSGVQA